MSVSQRLLPEFEHEMMMTRKILERVPEDKLGWKPHAKSMSMGRLAGHVAEIANWGTHTLKFDSYDIGPGPDGSNESHAMTSREDTLKKFDAWVAEAHDALEKTPDEAFDKTWTLTSQGREILAMPRGAVLRLIVMNQLIHHRGQLSVYLRLNDVPVPGMYGPSADEQ